MPAFDLRAMPTAQLPSRSDVGERPRCLRPIRRKSHRNRASCSRQKTRPSACECEAIGADPRMWTLRVVRTSCVGLPLIPRHGG